MLYVSRISYIEAVEWNEPGDHPGVGYFRYPPIDPDTGDISGEDSAILMGKMRHCDVPKPFRRAACTHIMDDHGFADSPMSVGDTVCPGDMVQVLANGRAGQVWHPKMFAQFYDRVEW